LKTATHPARELSAQERAIVSSLLLQTVEAASWINARTFRAKEHSVLVHIDRLEEHGFILRDREAYWPSLTGLAQLDEPVAASILDGCARLLPVLRAWYIDHQTKPLLVVAAAHEARLSTQATLQALRFLLESPGWSAGRSSEWLDDSAPAVCVDEGILRLPGLPERLTQLVDWQRKRLAGNTYPYGNDVSGVSEADRLPTEIQGLSTNGTTSCSEIVTSQLQTGNNMARVFFSYSHDDEQYRDQLEKHLAALKHQGLIDSWHDRRILAGSSFDKEIDEQLERADVILLLVSASFIDSRYCYGIEMRRALERHTQGLAQVIPVIVRPCDWQSTPLQGLLAVPRDGKAITTWANFDEAYADVARQVRAVVEKRTNVLAETAGLGETTVQVHPPTRALPRSSNLRLRKAFTDADKDKFLHQSFDFLAQFFEGSLQELQQRHADIECRYRRVDANTFTATIFRGGEKQGECAVVLGGAFRDGGITYSNDATSRGNSFNESLSVGHDDQTMFLKPMGMSFRGTREDKLSGEQAAEYYWEMLIASLQ
jgi:TIR domain